MVLLLCVSLDLAQSGLKHNCSDSKTCNHFARTHGLRVRCPSLDAILDLLYQTSMHDLVIVRRASVNKEGDAACGSPEGHLIECNTMIVRMIWVTIDHGCYANPAVLEVRIPNSIHKTCPLEHKQSTNMDIHIET